MGMPVAPNAPSTRALIMKGGGVKGLAFAGAADELAKHDYTFDTYVGTSAGALAAVLLAAGADPQRLEHLLRDKDFSEFLDFHFKWPWLSWLSLLCRPVKLLSLVFLGGLNSGKPLQEWLEEHVTRLMGVSQETGLTLHDIYIKRRKRVIVYAANERYGTVVFDGADPSKKASEQAAFAARCSSSVPFLFAPPTAGNEEPVFDGGVLNNYPVTTFVADNPGVAFVALYLSSSRRPRKASRFSALNFLQMLRTVIDIVTCRDERVIVDRYSDRTVTINVAPIGSWNFALSRSEKDLLVWSGRAAALGFVGENPAGPLPADFLRKVQEATETVTRLREQVRRARLLRSLRRLTAVVLLMLALYGLRAGWWSRVFRWGVGGPPATSTTLTFPPGTTLKGAILTIVEDKSEPATADLAGCSAEQLSLKIRVQGSIRGEKKLDLLRQLQLRLDGASFKLEVSFREVERVYEIRCAP